MKLNRKTSVSARGFAAESCKVSGSRRNGSTLHCVAAAVSMALLGMASPAAHAAPPQGDSGQEWAVGRILVKPRAGLPEKALAKILGAHGGKGRKIGKSNLFIVDLPPGSERGAAAKLAHNPHLKFAELDKRVKPSLAVNDPYMGSEWHLGKISAPSAWDATQGSGVTIAIIDTGVNDHPDLLARLVPGRNVLDNNSNTADAYGHGTAVAGTAAASSNNGIGVAGVAGQAQIMPIRVTDATGYAYYSTLAQGITYAADNGARIANVSFVSAASSSAVQSAAQYMKNKNGLVFVSAGNDGLQKNYTPTTTLIAVSATNSSDLKTSWSTYGNFVSLSAPGQSIYTTNHGGGYGSWWGTSFSSPVGAGVGALVMAAAPNLSSAQVEGILFSSAVDLGAAGRDSSFGYGRVDAYAAVQAALSSGGSNPPADAEAPTVTISAPLGSSTVSGLVPVDVSTADNVGVTQVDLRVNGSTVATDTSAPFAFSWDSTNLVNGTANLVAVAHDAAGNTGSTSATSVNVSNTTVVDTEAPQVSLSNPTDGASVSRNVSIRGSASDDSGSAGITQSLFINGSLVQTVSGSTLDYSWNTRKAASGAHTIVLQAQDAAGNSSSSATITVYKNTTSGGGKGGGGKGKKK